jgi:methylglutamate dehydrogenase subunit D
MSDRASALGAEFKPGLYGDVSNSAGITLSELLFDFTAEIAAFPGVEEDITKLIHKAEARIDGSLSFQIAQNRWLAAGSTKFRAALENGVSGAEGSFTDLSHGRSAITASGPKVEWVLSKLFAVDFRKAAFPAGAGLVTMHHDVFAQIYRTSADRFTVFVHRSFARSFWQTLRRAAEEVGYEVA